MTETQYLSVIQFIKISNNPNMWTPFFDKKEGWSSITEKYFTWWLVLSSLENVDLMIETPFNSVMWYEVPSLAYFHIFFVIIFAATGPLNILRLVYVQNLKSEGLIFGRLFALNQARRRNKDNKRSRYQNFLRNFEQFLR